LYEEPAVFGVSAQDPATFAGVAALLVANFIFSTGQSNS
jgi:hypothetical protein